MALEITGRLIEKYPTQQINERFKKREFVLDITDEARGYPNFAKMQAAQERCEMLDNFSVGDTLKVSFNIRGNKWEKEGRVNYITSLEAWRIERAGQADNGNYGRPAQQQQQGNYNSGGGQNNNFGGGQGGGNFNQGGGFGGGNVNDDLPF